MRVRDIEKERERERERENKEGDQREMRKQMKRGIEEGINYASIIKVSLLLLCAASQETDGGAQCVCVCVCVCVPVLQMWISLQMFCLNISAHVDVNVHIFLLHIQRSSLYVFSVVQCCMTDVHTSLYVRVCFYLVEVSKVCVFTSDHVEEDGNGGSPQLLLRDQSHLQDGTHHARDETDLVTA